MRIEPSATATAATVPDADVPPVLSGDTSLYFPWQADLLAYAHRGAGRPGSLTRPVGRADRVPPGAGRTVCTAARDPADGLVTFNTLNPASIRERAY